MKKINLYTDGSCNVPRRIGGWAYLLEHQGHTLERVGSAHDTTNNRMELTALLEGLRALKCRCEVRVFTDSKYLKEAFTEGYLEKWQANGWKTADKKAVKNQDLWLELLELAKVHPLEWIWVKGHAGNHYNERVDTLAVAARKALEGRM